MPDRVLRERAERVTCGASQTNSRRHGKVGPVTYPSFAVSGSGAYLRFADDTLAIDLAGANGAVALGYQPHSVTGAIYTQFMNGWTLSLPSVLEVEVSERMVNMVNTPVCVRWVRTGSEAVSAAVAIAREATGRDKIAVFEDSYHGWHPWTRQTTCLSVNFDDLSLDALIQALTARSTFAALLIESPRWHDVDAAYIERLKHLRAACTKAGTLLVFDDVVYAFRFASGGLQQTTEVVPDLACFSKALGNGLPVGCVTGPPDLMRRTSLRVSSTFGGEALGLAAANAVLELHAERDICGELREIGIDLRTRLDAALAGTPIIVQGTPQHFRFSSFPEELDRFLSYCIGDAEERVLIHRDANNVNLAMTVDIREKLVATIRRAARRC